MSHLNLENMLACYGIKLIHDNFLTIVNYHSSAYKRILIDSWKLDHPEEAKQFTDSDIFETFDNILSLHFGHADDRPVTVTDRCGQTTDPDHPYTAVFAP